MDNTNSQNTRCSKIVEENGSIACKCKGCGKLHVHDWLGDIESTRSSCSYVEVRFKNTRKGFYDNVNGLQLSPGDIVAVESSPGHDIGIVSLVGELVVEQMKKCGYRQNTNELKKVYRKAKPTDIEKWQEAINLEHSTMLKARQIALDLKLDMKIGDVEYQGDKTKAIFYYIADERVDFRELIKILAERFRVRIEMKQIGARQEAGRIGSIASCGREICCSTWITNFNSVTTNAARYQEISLNPQKLAGMCGKLKCCLNYELDAYLDERKDFPEVKAPLETEEGQVYFLKTDIFKRVMWFSYDRDAAVNVTAVPVERVKEIIKMNKNNSRPARLLIEEQQKPKVELDYANVVGQESLTRFDDKRNRSRKRNKKRFRKDNEK